MPMLSSVPFDNPVSVARWLGKKAVHDAAQERTQPDGGKEHYPPAPEWFVVRRPPRREQRQTSAQQCEGEVGQGNGGVVHDGWLS